MTTYQIEKELEPFVNKVCTVLTQPVNKGFNQDWQHAQFFTGKVTQISPMGVWLANLHTGMKSFFAFPIVGICEEQYLEEGDPRLPAVKEEMEAAKKAQQRPAPPVQALPTACQIAHGQKPGNFVPISELTKLVKKKS